MDNLTLLDVGKRKSSGHTLSFACIVLGAIAGYSGSMMFGGYPGWSPLLFIVGGSVVTIVLHRKLIQRTRALNRWISLACALLATVLVAAPLSYWSRHPNREKTFENVFGMLPMTGIRDLTVEQAWFDGRQFAIQFQADPELLDRIMTSPATRPATVTDQFSSFEMFRSGQLTWQELWSGTFTFASIVNDSWRYGTPMLRPAYKGWDIGVKPYYAVNAVWDESNGKVFVQAVEVDER